MTVGLLGAALLALALDAGAVDKLARGSQAERGEAVSALVAAGDEGAVPVLRALLEGRLYAGAEGPVLILSGATFRDAVTGAPANVGEEVDKVTINDLHATVLHLLGLHHEKLTFRYSGRDFRLTDVAGEVVKALVA